MDSFIIHFGITNRKQAIAIGISEAKEAGLKVPVQKSAK